jgi:hypothetical protein
VYLELNEEYDRQYPLEDPDDDEMQLYYEEEAYAQA